MYDTPYDVALLAQLLASPGGSAPRQPSTPTADDADREITTLPLAMTSSIDSVNSSSALLIAACLQYTGFPTPASSIVGLSPFLAVSDLPPSPVTNTAMCGTNVLEAGLQPATSTLEQLDWPHAEALIRQFEAELAQCRDVHTEPSPASRQVQPPRPPNAFILYRSHMHESVRRQNPQLTVPEVSKLLGKMWREEADDGEMKTKFRDMAVEERQLHKKLYPDYKQQYCTASGPRRRRRRQKKQ